MFRSNVSEVPFHVNRSMRLPSSGAASVSSVYAPRKGAPLHSVSVGANGASIGGGGAMQLQNRYTNPFVAKPGCSAMPSRPRSDAKLTPRSSTVEVTTPFMTRWTLPVFFSMTNQSFAPGNAMPIGVTRPVTAVRTDRFGSTTCGPDCARAAGLASRALPISAAIAVDSNVMDVFMHTPRLHRNVAEYRARTTGFNVATDGLVRGSH